MKTSTILAYTTGDNVIGHANTTRDNWWWQISVFIKLALPSKGGFEFRASNKGHSSRKFCPYFLRKLKNFITVSQLGETIQTRKLSQIMHYYKFKGSIYGLKHFENPNFCILSVFFFISDKLRFLESQLMTNIICKIVSVLVAFRKCFISSP